MYFANVCFLVMISKFFVKLASMIIFCVPVSLFFPTDTMKSVNASTNDVQLYSIDSKPYGKDFVTWTIAWWKWIIAIPQDQNPTNDHSGQFCNMNQSGPVWFLAGTSGGPAVRECIIPAGKAILLPVLNDECSFAEQPMQKTEQDLRKCAREFFDCEHGFEFAINQTRIPNIENYRETSPLFNVTFPQNNIYGVPPSMTKAVSDGYWIFIKDLQAGYYEIHSVGWVAECPNINPQFFTSDVTYHLRVTAG